MEHEKKVVFGILILTSFVLIVAVSSLYVQMQVESGNLCGCVIPIYLFIPLLASIGLFIGTLVYYLLSPKFVVKPEKDTLLKFFNSEEKSIIEILLSRKGRALQSEIVRESGISRVKVFRVLERLRRKGFIKKESYGKTNRITLNEEFKTLFD